MASQLGLAVVVDAAPRTPVDDLSPTARLLAERLSHRASAVGVVDGVVDGPDDTTSDGRTPDLVVGITSPEGRCGCAPRLARRGRAPLVLVVRGLGAVPAQTRTEPPMPGASSTEAPPDEVTRSLRAADRVTISSEALRRPLHDHGVADDRIALLPPWVGSAPSSLDRADARRRLGWPGRPFVAVHAGSTAASHRVADVVEAARRLGPDCLLIPPVADEPDRALALVAADVVVLTDLTDLATCLSAGRPVVAATDPEGAMAAELARTDGAGLVVPPDDPAGLAEALLDLRADPLRRVAMGLAAIAYAETHLSPGAVLARFDRIVDAAIAHH